MKFLFFLCGLGSTCSWLCLPFKQWFSKFGSAFPRTSGGVSHMFLFHESFFTLTTYAFPTRGRRWLHLLIQIRYPQHISELPAHFLFKYQKTWVTLPRLLALDFLLLGVNGCCYSELKNFESLFWVFLLIKVGNVCRCFCSRRAV